MNDNAASPEPDVSADNPISEHWVWAGANRAPLPRAFFDHMTTNWGEREPTNEIHPAVANSETRRDRLAERFAGKTLVIPTGNLKVRSNDTDFRFRAGSDFFYLTGSVEPDCVLVITPGSDAATSTLYVAPRRDHHTYEFLADARYGELWVGARRGVIEAARYYRIETAPLDYLAKDLSSLVPDDVLCVRGIDAGVDALLAPNDGDALLTGHLSEMRLVKDAFEVAQLQLAIDYTVRGFEDVVRALPTAEGRGERVVEGVFNLRARVEGNDVGYGTIAASGSNATVLHWTENTGPVRRGDLLLLDAGVECHNLYTADVTRTMPVSGTFSPAQRRVYDLVLAAQEAGIAAVRPGAPFHAPHDAATRVLTEGLVELGVLSEGVDSALRRDRQTYRRYTLHGTSHMLGIDVHDCTSARNDVLHGDLAEGFVLTIEPGLYFQPHDLTVPVEYRGIGVRIEDDILVTAEGARNLSAALPRRADEVEEWMARLWASPAGDLSR